MVAVAQEKNPELLAARHELESRDAKVKQSINDLLPGLSLSNTYTRSQDDTPDSNRWSARASANLDLFNMDNFSSIASSRSSRDQSKASYRAASADVMQALRRAFASLLFAQNQLNVSRVIRNIRQKNANLVSLRYDSGRESKGNKLRSQAELMQSTADENQSQRDHLVAQQELSRQLGLDNFETLVASGSMAISGSTNSTAALSDWTNNHPDVQLSRAQVKTAETALSSARSTLWPTLTASYSRSVQGPHEFPSTTYDWSASGILSLPVFSGGPTNTYYSVVSAKRNVEKAEESFRATRYRVLTNLRNSQADFSGAIEQVDVQKAFLEAARQRNQEADVRYSSGLMSYEDWERIVTERVNFEKSVIQAERDAIFAEAQWDNARGIGLGEQQ
jgi:outer membrane protein TolC